MNTRTSTIEPERAVAPARADGASEVDRLAAEAREAFLLGDAGRVRGALGAALELEPGHGELALALGHAEMNAGNLEAALAAYWSATLRSPNLASAHANHALVLHLLGREEEASRDALRAISLDPADIVALKVLARVHLKAGQHEAAQQACQLVLEQHAEDAEARQMFEEAIIQEATLAEFLPAKPRTVAPPHGLVPPLVKPPKCLAKSS